MRTDKLLIGAMATMMFAACQNEEWADRNQNSLGRAEVSVTLSADKAGLDASTRLDSDLKFETGDEIGVCLVDPAGTLVDNAHVGNAKFVRQENGSFTSPSTISVGKQLFYYQYNPENTTTNKGIVVKNLGVQKADATTAEMAKKDFFVSPVVDLSGYEAGAIELPMTMYSIYGYGDIKIKNSTPEDFEIQKIIITSNEGFVLGGALQPATVVTANSDLKVDITKKNITTEEIAKAFAKADKVYVDAENPNKRAAIEWVKGESKDKGSVAVSFLTGSDGVVVKAGGETSTRVLIPVGKYAASDFKVTVYTSKGSQEFVGTNAEVVASVDSKVEIYNSRKKTITADVKNLKPAADNTITVISENDLIASLKQFGGTESKEVTVNAAAALTIDKEVLANIPSNITLKFAENSDITFDAGETTMNLTGVKAADATTSPSTITLKNGNFNVSSFELGAVNNLVLANGANVTFGKEVKGGGNSNTIVEEGATLNVVADFTSY